MQHNTHPQKFGNFKIKYLKLILYLSLAARRMRRSVDYQQTTTQQVRSCPVSWNVEIDNKRRPIVIKKARCNGPGTLCKSSKGRPSCEEVKFELTVFKLLGMDPEGTQTWQEKQLLIPVACTCQMYCR